MADVFTLTSTLEAERNELSCKVKYYPNDHRVKGWKERLMEIDNHLTIRYEYSDYLLMGLMGVIGFVFLWIVL